nr:assembly of actin patch protein [Exophiala xenobiotica]
MPAFPFKVKAVFEYKSEEPDDLKFENGQIITVTAEEDEDWYAGAYVNGLGEKIEGIFPKNFVEKYEPAIPTRPSRVPKRAPTQDASDPVPEHLPEPPAPQAVVPPVEPLQSPPLEEPGPPKELSNRLQPDTEEAHEPPSAPKPAAPPSPTMTSKSPPPTSTSKPPPPLAEKPNSSSFKDRIAAFNKPAAAPITPFKPGGGSGTGFIKKPFVAPPPSRNAYVPPPREQPVQKPYHREEEDTSLHDQGMNNTAERPVAQQEPGAEDQPKPQSLKDRIALLQKQQMEQAARNAEKKDKPKKPPKKRVEPAETIEEPAPAEPSVPVPSNDDVPPRRSVDLVEDESDMAPPARHATGLTGVTPQPQPVRELVSDTNDADDSGAGDDEDAQETSTEEERPKSKGADQWIVEPTKQPVADEEEQERDEEDDDQDEDEDPEVRRRRELRERMAKMSGGMGMMGMFGPPGGMGTAGARKSKPAESTQSSETQPQEELEERAAPVRIMALPGMSNSAPTRHEEPAEDSGDEDTAHPTPQEFVAHGDPDDHVPRPLERRSTDRPAPLPPQDRVAPPAPPRETRVAAGAPPPPPVATRPMPPAPQSPTSRPPPPLPPAVPTAGEARADDEDNGESELSEEEEIATKSRVADTPTSPAGVPPPPPLRVAETPKLETNDLTTSPAADKRASRPPPPIPVSPTAAAPQARAPPPPPPGFPSSRRSTSDSRGLNVPQPPAADVSDEDEVTEYDGDYDTDIASSAKHKDALKAHNRDSSLDEGVLTDDAIKSPKNLPTRAAPPMPPVPAPPPREVPPPPSQAVPRGRSSMDAPRAAPPPVPPPKGADDEEYDPYRYSTPSHGPPALPTRSQYSNRLQSPKEELEEEDLYGASSPQGHMPPHPTERSAPPPPPERTEYNQPPTGFAPPPPSGSPRGSLDVKRSGTVSRRSMEQSRTSSEQGYIAHDLDLGRGTMWWTQDNMPPPSLQGRSDVLFEMESSSSTKRGGRTTISKDVYVLYMDYSQTTIKASFDSADPSHVTMEQKHERPPPSPRRDQLENASAQYGTQIARAAAGMMGSSVADGSAQGLVHELLRPHSTALLPIGSRAYGALVYANLGNASTQQYDEIRPGDIVTFRNARFAGHKGSLHAKYSMDVGKPEHVAVVAEWDGTKKKIRALEQGRDLEKGKKPKVREESFKVGDLKSGEVMVWRVMPRTWVGWDAAKS